MKSFYEFFEETKKYQLKELKSNWSKADWDQLRDEEIPNLRGLNFLDKIKLVFEYQGLSSTIGPLQATLKLHPKLEPSINRILVVVEFVVKQLMPAAKKAVYLHFQNRNNWEAITKFLSTLLETILEMKRKIVNQFVTMLVLFPDNMDGDSLENFSYELAELAAWVEHNGRTLLDRVGDFRTKMEIAARQN